MKVYVVLQHLYDEVKLFEPVCLTQQAADAMVERLRVSEKHGADQPIEWRELEVDGTLARRAVDEAAGTLRDRVEGLRAQVAELERSQAEIRSLTTAGGLQPGDLDPDGGGERHRRLLGEVLRLRAALAMALKK